MGVNSFPLFSLARLPLRSHIWQVEQKPGGRGRGRGREWATLGVHHLSWLLSNNRLEKVPFVSVPHTSSNRLLLSNQDKGCTPSVAHSLALPLGPALLNLWIMFKNAGNYAISIKWNWHQYSWTLFYSETCVISFVMSYLFQQLELASSLKVRSTHQAVYDHFIWFFYIKAFRPLLAHRIVWFEWSTYNLSYIIVSLWRRQQYSFQTFICLGPSNTVPLIFTQTR